MKSNPLPSNADELPGELLLEVARNIFAAACIQGLLAHGDYVGDGTADAAFRQADSMMRRSKLPQLITKLQSKSQ